MGILEPITHKEEIEELVDKAQKMYGEAIERLEKQKKKTAKSLENLGRQKLELWNGEMNDFLAAFGMFGNIQMRYKMDMNYSFTGMDTEPQQLMLNMERATLTANEMLQTGAIAVSAGALIGIASYGGAMMFAHASTGTAIAALHGAAKTNAALAWFGGGSLKAGGMGKLGGKLVLSGIVVAPILIVAGVITAAKSKEKLSEAWKMYAETECAVSEMNTIITGMKGIEVVSENYQHFLKRMSEKFKPFICEMEDIAKDYTPGADGKINFDDLTEIEQRTLHLAWLMAQLQYHSLSTVILTEEGDLDSEGQELLSQAEIDFYELSSEVTKLNNEKAEIKRLLGEAKKNFAVSKDNYLKLKKRLSDSLIAYGKKKIDIFTEELKKTADKVIGFEDFIVENLVENTYFDIPMEQVNNSIIDNIEKAELFKKNSKQNENSSYIELAAYGDIPNLSNTMGKGIHDISLWLADEMDVSQAEQFEFAGVSMIHIENTVAIIQIITGKESLEEAKMINKDVMSAVELINKSTKKFEATISEIDTAFMCYEKLEKTIKPFLKKLDSIKSAYNAEEVSFGALSEEEQKVCEFAWNLLKMESIVLSASILKDDNNQNILYIEDIEPMVRDELKGLKKRSFKMNGIYAMAADVIWKPYAVKSMIMGFLAMGIMIAVGLFQVVNTNWYGISGVVGALVSMPMFFYFKNFPQSKLFLWRCIRVVAGIVLFAGIQILGMR